MPRLPSATRHVSNVFPHVTEHVDDLPRQFAVDAREAEIAVRERLRSLVEDLLPRGGQHGQDGATVGRMRITLHQLALFQLVQGEGDGGRVHHQVPAELAERAGAVAGQLQGRHQQVTGAGQLVGAQHRVDRRGHGLVRAQDRDHGGELVGCWLIMGDPLLARPFNGILPLDHRPSYPAI
jgi:hypothetical protein